MMTTLPLLTADDVAAQLRVTRKQVYRLVREAGLPALRIGERSLRFDQDEIDEWKAARRG